ncbi:hypothetical protein SDJN02_06956, partial [Cucurbita argyrosperma subsp. argyrosperma]
MEGDLKMEIFLLKNKNSQKLGRITLRLRQFRIQHGVFELIDKSGNEHPMEESEELLTDMKFKEKRVSGSVCTGRHGLFCL